MLTIHYDYLGSGDYMMTTIVMIIIMMFMVMIAIYNWGKKQTKCCDDILKSNNRM